MFKNRKGNGKNNLCDETIHNLRKGMTPKMSLCAPAEKLQIEGIDVDKNAIQRIECGKRFVTDIELAKIAKIFGVSCDQLISTDTHKY